MTDEIAQTLALLDEHDLNRGRAPHPRNPQAAEEIVRRRAPHQCPACYRGTWVTHHAHEASEIVWCRTCSTSIEQAGDVLDEAVRQGWGWVGGDVWQCPACKGAAA